MGWESVGLLPPPERLLATRLAKTFHKGYLVKGKRESWPMTPSNVHILHPTSPPLAGYLRVGHTGHHKLEALHAADRLGFSRLVFDAAYVVGQADFLRAQKAAGREMVIDLNVAETAMPGRFGSAVGKLPWGNPDRPSSGDFGGTRNDDFAKRFAEFVANIGPSAVLAPVHASDGDEWRSIDIRATEHLRRSGGMSAIQGGRP
jgi:hypothetical protein